MPLLILHHMADLMGSHRYRSHRSAAVGAVGQIDHRFCGVVVVGQLAPYPAHRHAVNAAQAHQVARRIGARITRAGTDAVIFGKSGVDLV